MIDFLKLRACSVRIKGHHALKWGTCSKSNTEQQYSIEQRTSVGFKLAVRGDSGAGGLVAPLPCTAYFGNLLNCLTVPCHMHSKSRPSLFVHVSQHSLT